MLSAVPWEAGQPQMAQEGRGGRGVEGTGPSLTNRDPDSVPVHQDLCGGRFLSSCLSRLTHLDDEPVRHSCALMNSQMENQIVMSVPSPPK